MSEEIISLWRQLHAEDSYKGHAGRPGQVGGSVPRDKQDTDTPVKIPKGCNVRKSDGVTYSKTLEQYIREANDVEKGAHRFYQEQLQGLKLQCKDHKGKPVFVEFTGGGKHQTWIDLKKGLDDTPQKAEYIQYIPETVKYGVCWVEPKATKIIDNKPEFKDFLTYAKIIHSSDGYIQMEVDVGRIKDSRDENRIRQKRVYNLNYEGYKSWGTRKAGQKAKVWLKHIKSPASVNGDTISAGRGSVSTAEDSISNLYEIVKVRVKEIGIKENKNITERLMAIKVAD